MSVIDSGSACLTSSSHHVHAAKIVFALQMTLYTGVIIYCSAIKVWPGLDTEMKR